jgi:hypothetical protein
MPSDKSHYRVVVEVRVPRREAALAVARRLARLPGEPERSSSAVQVTQWEGERLVEVVGAGEYEPEEKGGTR